MKRKIALAALAVLICFAGLAGIRALQIKSMIDAGANAGPWPQTVEVRPVQKLEWEQELFSVGTVNPVNGTTVRSESEGVVREILFNPGSRVEARAILVQLDTDIEQAQLEIAQAALELARSNVIRMRELHSRNNVSNAELDRSEAEFAGAKATVANLQATVDKRTIRAPFSGRLGIRQLSPGDYVTKGQEIVKLQSYEKVFVDFEFPQNRISYLHEGMEVRITTDAWPGEVFTGYLTAINPDIDATTRSISVQATFENPDGKLLPGMFVDARAIRKENREVVVVPRSAIMHANYGDSVFVVTKPEGEGPESVKQQIVRLGESKGDFIEVVQGLQGDEEIVSAGAFKLSNGSLITRSSVGTVEPELNPAPAEG
ncbi:MAG: efflux RND transporter periplasmic adaptor subunit [Puniceicoccaceae bacterium]